MGKKLSIQEKQHLYGWGFLAPAAALLILLNFVPIVMSFLLSLQSGKGNQLHWAGLSNYVRMFQDRSFRQALSNTLLYMVTTVPVMIALGIVLAVLLNDPKLKSKGLYRTCIFLPAAVSLVASAVIFRSLFATDGFVNAVLIKLGILQTGYNFFGNPTSARILLIVVRIWRWVGYEMIFFLAGLQSIDISLYEAAKIDGASRWQAFWKITIPLLKPTILFATVMCLNSALQVYDESVNLTGGGPGTSTIALAHYIYNTSFVSVPNFGYSCAMSMLVLVFVAVMTFIQMKVGDTRE